MLINFSKYFNTHSLIHSLNPLTKILSLMIFVLMISLCSSFSEIVSLFIILLFIIEFSGVSFRHYFKPIWSMKILFIFILIINFFCHISFISSVIMICKVSMIVMYSCCLLFTTTTNELAFGFFLLLRPLTFFHIPVSKISMAISLSLNFIPIMFSETNKILKSQKSRGFNYDNVSFRNKVLGIKSIFIPMFVNSMKRADRVSDAFIVKQYNFYGERSSVIDASFKLSDSYIICCHIIILSFVLIKEVVL